MSLIFPFVDLDDVCTIKGGKRLPKGEELVKEITQHPYIRARDIGNGKISFTDPVYITNQAYEKISRYIVSEGDVVITIVGANIGDAAFIEKQFNGANLTENAVKLTANNELYPKFLKYSLTTKYMKGYFQTVASGAAQGKLGLYKIKKVQIPLPPFTTQQKIAHFLSAYDDLIENNLKRIKLLEEMVQITYEEWFVRMKFPWYEQAVIDAETGLPEGWKSWSLNDKITIKHGYAYKGDFFRSEETTRILLTPGNFKIGGGLKSDKLKYYDEQAESPDVYVLNTHDLLITMTDLSKMADTLGYPLLVPSSNEKIYLHNQRLGKVLPVKGMPFPKYFYYMLFQDERYRAFVVGSSSGATVKHTSPSKILAFKPKLPPIDSGLIKSFNDTVKPLFKTINHLFQENILLAEARDILLPRLMTGMIDANTLELPELLESEKEVV